MSSVETKAEAEPEHIGVCIVVLNNKDEILLGERLNSYGEGLLGIPGGRINIDELLHEAAMRELKEETGIETKSAEYVGVVRDHQRTYNFIHFGFVVSGVADEPKNLEPEKCKGWAWYSREKLPENILPVHKSVIDMYLKQDGSLRDLV